MTKLRSQVALMALTVAVVALSVMLVGAGFASAANSFPKNENAASAGAPQSGSNWINAQARAQCGGKDPEDAPDCWVKALWVATQCPFTGPSSATTPCAPGGSEPFPLASISVVPAKPTLDGPDQFVSNDQGFQFIRSTLLYVTVLGYSTGPIADVAREPQWFNEDSWNIDVKYGPGVADAVQKLSVADMEFLNGYWERVVLQKCCGLVAQVKTTEARGYDLVLAKGSADMKFSTPENSSGKVDHIHEGGNYFMDYCDVNGECEYFGPGGLTTSRLAVELSQQLGVPVNDKTGITSKYVLFGPPLLFIKSANRTKNIPPSKKTIIKGLRAEGLDLVRSRGTEQIVTIESVHPPYVK
jgi:uncharacterized protein (TIGR03435 family)